ncbi:TPA: hypothetical protein HA259_07995 [Thermoplasmata archaeon]|nr:hypothetical protein [Thermoplasmata archaeon]
MTARVGAIGICLLLASVLASSTCQSGLPPQEAATQEPGESTWTVMVYMAADTENALPWEMDINELEAADQVDGTNIIALVDPEGLANSMLLRIEHDDNYFDPTIVSTELDDDGAVIPGGGEVNTGSPATLRDFIVYSSTAYPAENLVLVMWGHGAGWRGLCPDGLDILTLPELRSALTMTNEAIGRGLDLVILDTCSGGTLELAVEISDYADLLVASEVLVPSTGLPYMQIMDTIAWDPTQTPRDFAEELVERYIDWTASAIEYSTSMGLFDLDTVEGVVERLDRLSELGLGFDRLYHEEMSASLLECEFSEDEWLLDMGLMGEAFGARDLPLEIKFEALLLVQAYQSCVARYEADDSGGVVDGIEINRTSGLSLYAPSADEDDLAYSELRIALGRWDEFSHAIGSAAEDALSGPGPQLDIYDSLSDADDLPDSLTLTWPEDSGWNYTSYLVTVFLVMPHGLVWCSEIEATTHIVRVDRVVGNLLLSVSAFVADEAYAHDVLAASLAKIIEIEVSFVMPEYSNAERLEVAVDLPAGDRVSADCVDGSCTLDIAVPYQADIGETVMIELVDLDSGQVIAEKAVVVRGEDIAVSLTATDVRSEDAGAAATAGLIATLAMLGIASVIYWNFVRRR